MFGSNEIKRELRIAKKIDFLIKHSVEAVQTKKALDDAKKKLSALKKLYVVKRVPNEQREVEKGLYQGLAKAVQADS